MARSYGRLFTSIWNDKDFRPLSVGAKLMYAFLISQDDIEHSGIIPFRPPRWAKELGEPAEDVTAWLKELDQHRYIITDEEEGELLVRSLIRRDDIWKQPNVFKAAAASAKAAKSPQIKAALYHEIRRLTLVGTGRETHAIRDELLSHLEPFANRSPNPPEGFPRGSSNHDGGDNGSPAEPSQGAFREDSAEPDSDGSVDNSRAPNETAGQDPSRTVSEGLANHSAGVTGKGEGYGPVLGVAVPRSPTPSSVTGREPMRPLWPAAVPDAKDSPDPPPDPAALVDEVRAIRPDWASRSVRRALAIESVAERPWPLVARAMLAVARDPESKQPGRIAGDGPWWEPAGTKPSAVPWPEWCGDETCNPNTRRREDPATGRDRGTCPDCHPNARAS